MFVTGVNCSADTAIQEMTAVQKRFDKTTGNVAYHAYQSFKPGEVTPEQCHRLGVKLAQKMWGDRYQVLVATHFNTGTYHSHLVVNAVGMWDGKKFDCSKRAYYQLRKISDELCAEQGLSVIQNPYGKTPRKLYFAEKNSEPTRYNLMQEAIDKALTMSTNDKIFCAVMRKLGYVVDFNPRHKYATIRSVNSKKPVRLWRLGKGYDREAIFNRLRENERNNSVETYQRYYEFTDKKPVARTLLPRQARVKGTLKTAKKVTGLRAIYLRYCYLLGYLLKKNPRRPLSPEDREACRFLGKITAQTTLVSRNKLQDISSVERFIQTTESEMKLLIDYRESLRRHIRSCHEPDEKQSLIINRDDCTKALAALRRDKKTAEGILADQPKIRETIQIEERMIESIRKVGAITLALARPLPEGGYELISGHRRLTACQVLGLESMPVFVRNMTDDEAMIAMVDANLQRETILPSEKTFAYKMKLDAIKHKGVTSAQVGQKLLSVEKVADEAGESRNQIKWYIRLTYLIPELLEMVDEGKIAFNPAVELSYLDPSQQKILMDEMSLNDCTPSHAQAIRLKKMVQDYVLSDAAIGEILAEEKPNQQEQIKFRRDDFKQYFPPKYTGEQMKRDIIRGLELLKRQRERSRDAR